MTHFTSISPHTNTRSLRPSDDQKSRDLHVTIPSPLHSPSHSPTRTTAHAIRPHRVNVRGHGPAATAVPPEPRSCTPACKLVSLGAATLFGGIITIGATSSNTGHLVGEIILGLTPVLIAIACYARIRADRLAQTQQRR